MIGIIVIILKLQTCSRFCMMHALGLSLIEVMVWFVIVMIFYFVVNIIY